MVKFKSNETLSNLSESLENYLETIAILKRKKRYARIGDIAKSLNVKSSSVNVAIKLLTKNDLVIHEKYGYVDLTEYGGKIAFEIQRKHNILYKFLKNLLFISSKVATKEACGIEHLVSIETTYKIKRLYSLLKRHFLAKNEDMSNFKKYLEKRK